MTPEALRWLLAGLTLLGGAVALVGVVRAAAGAYRALGQSVYRYGRALRLQRHEAREIASAREADPQADSAPFIYASMRRYRAEGLTRASWANSSFLGMIEGHRVLREAFRSVAGNLALTIGGLVIGTTAGILSVLLL